MCVGSEVARSPAWKLLTSAGASAANVGVALSDPIPASRIVASWRAPLRPLSPGPSGRPGAVSMPHRGQGAPAGGGSQMIAMTPAARQAGQCRGGCSARCRCPSWLRLRVSSLLTLSPVRSWSSSPSVRWSGCAAASSASALSSDIICPVPMGAVPSLRLRPRSKLGADLRGSADRSCSCAPDPSALPRVASWRGAGGCRCPARLRLRASSRVVLPSVRSWLPSSPPRWRW